MAVSLGPLVMLCLCLCPNLAALIKMSMIGEENIRMEKDLLKWSPQP